MKKLSILLIGLMMVGVLAACGGKQSAGEDGTIKIRINHEMGPGTPTARAFEKLGELVAEKTDGKVEFEYYHSAQLAKERESYDLLQSGSLEMIGSGSQIVTAITPEFGALVMPYAFTSQDHLHKVLNSEIGEEMHKQILEKKGMRVLGFTDRAPRHLTTSDDWVVQDPSELDGLKIRIREIPIQIEAWKAMGASPVPMAMAEVYTGLQTGTIVAQENPSSLIDSYSLNEVQNNMMLTGHVREVVWLAVSEKVWETLPADVQTAIEESVPEAMELGNTLTWEEEEAYIAGLKEKGMNVVELSDSEIAKFAEKAQTIVSDFKGDWKPGLYEDIQSYAD
jgi:TRAP-type transport system periplasmic protein